MGETSKPFSIQELGKLCQEIDPYHPLPVEMLQKLHELGLHDLSDPFAITNQLLLMLEDALEKELQQKNPARPLKQ